MDMHADTHAYFDLWIEFSTSLYRQKLKWNWIIFADWVFNNFIWENAILSDVRVYRLFLAFEWNERIYVIHVLLPVLNDSRYAFYFISLHFDYETCRLSMKSIAFFILGFKHEEQSTTNYPSMVNVMRTINFRMKRWTWWIQQISLKGATRRFINEMMLSLFVALTEHKSRKWTTN